MSHTESSLPLLQRDLQSPTPDLSVPHIGTWSFRFDLPPAPARFKKTVSVYTTFERALTQSSPTKYKGITYLQHETFASWYTIRYPQGVKLHRYYKFLASLNLPRHILDDIDTDDSVLVTAVERCQKDMKRAKQTSTSVEGYLRAKKWIREKLMRLVEGSGFDGSGLDWKYRKCGWRRSGSRRDVKRLEQEQQSVKEELESIEQSESEFGFLSQKQQSKSQLLQIGRRLSPFPSCDHESYDKGRLSDNASSPTFMATREPEVLFR